jgi:hypothetical protein
MKCACGLVPLIAVMIAPVFSRGLISEISIAGLVVIGAECAQFEYS